MFANCNVSRVSISSRVIYNFSPLSLYSRVHIHCVCLAGAPHTEHEPAHAQCDTEGSDVSDDKSSLDLEHDLEVLMDDMIAQGELSAHAANKDLDDDSFEYEPTSPAEETDAPPPPIPVAMPSTPAHPSGELPPLPIADIPDGRRRRARRGERDGIEWGPFRLKRLPPAYARRSRAASNFKQFGGWTARCPFHRATETIPCTKSMVVMGGDAQDTEDCLRRLKFWCSTARCLVHNFTLHFDYRLMGCTSHIALLLQCCTSSCIMMPILRDLLLHALFAADVS